MSMTADQIVRLLLARRRYAVARLWALTADYHTAEDLFSDLVAEAIRQPERFADEAHLDRWLKQLIRFRALNDLQRLRRPGALSEGLLEQLASDEQAETVGSPQVDALQRCLLRLSPYGQQLVELRYREGISGAVLAERLGRQLNTVYVALARVHKQLGACVRELLEGAR